MINNPYAYNTFGEDLQKEDEFPKEIVLPEDDEEDVEETEPEEDEEDFDDTSDDTNTSNDDTNEE